MAFIDHYTHLYEIVRHQISYMQLYNTQHSHLSVTEYLSVTAITLSRSAAEGQQRSRLQGSHLSKAVSLG